VAQVWTGADGLPDEPEGDVKEEEEVIDATRKEFRKGYN
jgi:hypothetical protein